MDQTYVLGSLDHNDYLTTLLPHRLNSTAPLTLPPKSVPVVVRVSGNISR